MYQLQSTEIFDQWLRNLRDRKGRARILARLESVQLGSLGDVKAVGDGVLCGGDKSTQARDIGKARRILRDLAKE